MNKRLVLLVDDNEDIRTHCRLLLDKHFQVEEACQGQEALQKMESLHIKPFAIITDFNMPILNGMEFVKRLRSNEMTCHIPVAMFSGNEEVLRLMTHDENLTIFMKSTGFSGLLGWLLGLERQLLDVQRRVL